MTDHPFFLSTEQVLAIHGRLIEEFGGEPSIRDHGLLESAVRLPRSTFDGKLLHGSIGEMAGAYLFHLCMNHPFVDGNKRTALAAAEVFLIVNDATLDATEDELYGLTIGVAASRTSKAEITEFFAERVAE